MQNEFLDNLIVGSKVIIDNSYIGVVVNITPKRSFDVQFTEHNVRYGNKIRFNKYGIHKIDEYRNNYIQEWTYEKEMEIKNIRKNKQLLIKIERINWENISMDKLEQILKIVES